jgi:hypothetical protein
MAQTFEILDAVAERLRWNLTRVIEPSRLQVIQVTNGRVEHKIDPPIFPIRSLQLHPSRLEVSSEVEIRGAEIFVWNHYL